MEKVSGRWSCEDSGDTLTDIDLTVRAGHLLALTGPVGAGKTSVLQAVLGELPTCGGRISVSGRVSYSSQEPWLFSGSVRDNILFGRPHDRERYRRVVEVCALHHDLAQMEFGDRTLVGDRGVSLSGGQRARLSLARAVYTEADIYLLDDPLSAVDVHVGRHLYSKCIRGFLKNKAVVLVTHQVQYLHDADEILIVRDGRVEKRGNSNNLTELACLQETSDREKQEHCDDTANIKENGDFPNKKTEEIKKDESKTPENTKEVGVSGSVSGSVYLKYFTTGGGPGLVSFVFLILMNLTCQALYSGSDVWLSHWTTREEEGDVRDLTGNETSLPAPVLPSNVTFSLRTVREGHYYYLGVYAAIIVSLLVASMIRTVHFFYVSMTSSVNLHDKMFRRLLRAPPRFFDVNPSGNSNNLQQRVIL